MPDWHAAYGVTPLLLTTFVDPQRFDGTCYHAVNWIVVGTTTGRGRNDRHRRRVRAHARVGTCGRRLFAAGSMRRRPIRAPDGLLSRRLISFTTP